MQVFRFLQHHNQADMHGDSSDYFTDMRVSRLNVCPSVKQNII